jgi:hypothetical protein
MAVLRKKTFRLELRYDIEWRSHLEHRHAATGASYSEIVRRAVLGMPPPPALSPPLAQWDKDAVTALTKIGTLLNQIARRMHQSPMQSISVKDFQWFEGAVVSTIRSTIGLIEKPALVERLSKTRGTVSRAAGPASAMVAPTSLIHALTLTPATPHPPDEAPRPVNLRWLGKPSAPPSAPPEEGPLTLGVRHVPKPRP